MENFLTTAGVREAGYDFDEDERGVIENPGKFEGEPWYVVSLWDAVISWGGGDVEIMDGETPVAWFKLDADMLDLFGLDAAEFPIGQSWIGVWEDSQGFVRHDARSECKCATIGHCPICAPSVDTVTGIGLECWASYLVNGDDSGIDDDDKRAADAFAVWLGGDIVDVSEESEFSRPDAGTNKAGTCVTYTAIIRKDK